jgi:hypothetical protein
MSQHGDIIKVARQTVRRFSSGAPQWSAIRTSIVNTYRRLLLSFARHICPGEPSSRIPTQDRDWIPESALYCCRSDETFLVTASKTHPRDL